MIKKGKEKPPGRESPRADLDSDLYFFWRRRRRRVDGRKIPSQVAAWLATLDPVGLTGKEETPALAVAEKRRHAGGPLAAWELKLQGVFRLELTAATKLDKAKRNRFAFLAVGVDTSVGAKPALTVERENC